MKRFFFLGLSLLVGSLFFMGTAHAQDALGTLVKGSGPTVYYSYKEGRYAFPDEQVFFSWYKDFSSVATISDTELASQLLKGNIPFRSGQLVKIMTDPKVYVVTKGNLLRWVSTESLATSIFGEAWASKVRDISDTNFQDYVIGAPIEKASDYADDTSLIKNIYDVIRYAFLSDQSTNTEGETTTTSTLQSLIPPNTTIERTSAYGFDGTTSSSLQEIKTWFSTHIGGSPIYSVEQTLSVEGASLPIAGENYAASEGESFRHRGWIFTKASETSQSEWTVTYSDIVFPKNFITYPQGMNDPAVYEWNKQTGYVKNMAITLDSIQKISDWYTVSAPKYGWNIEQSAIDLSAKEAIFQLKKGDTVITVDITDVYGVRAIETETYSAK